jgi:hypothetical protein
MKRFYTFLMLVVSCVALTSQASLVEDDAYLPQALSYGSANGEVTFSVFGESVVANDYIPEAARVPANLAALSDILYAGTGAASSSARELYLGGGETLSKPNVASLPEPSVLLLLATGLVALGLSRRRNRG